VSGAFGTRAARNTGTLISRAFWAGYDGDPVPRQSVDAEYAYHLGESVRRQDEIDATDSQPTINGIQVSQAKYDVWQAMPPGGWTEAKSLLPKVPYNVRSIGRALQELSHMGLIEREPGQTPVYRRPQE